MGIRLVSGTTDMVDWSANTVDLEAGTAVQMDVAGIAILHTPIAASDTDGAVSWPGSGMIYEIDKASATDTFAIGAGVDVSGLGGTTAAEFTAATAGNGDEPIGRCVAASSATDTTVRFVHRINA